MLTSTPRGLASVQAASETDMISITFQRPSGAEYKITVPGITVETADKYSHSIGLANTEHLMMRILLDQLLTGIILPRVEYTPEVKAELDAMEAQLAQIRKDYEEARLAPCIPSLSVAGVPMTLAQIEAALKARSAVPVVPVVPEPVAEPVTEPQPKPESVPEPEPEPVVESE